MLAKRSIHDIARGRWHAILPALGISSKFLTNKHGPCPICGGKDRFRYDDKGGNGTYFCGNVSCGPGNGVDLVMKFLKLDFREARDRIAEAAGEASVKIAKAVDDTKIAALAENLWHKASPLTGFDPVSVYLAKRGIKLAPLPHELRYLADALYVHDDKSRTRHPAMLARFAAPDATRWTVHRTFLDEKGNKADLPKRKMFVPGPCPQGGAIRLAHSAETMGIAEGVETALSAMLLNDVPVWAAADAGKMTRWQPPPAAKNIIIFADEDSSYTGQRAAVDLAHRLVSEGYHVDVRYPGSMDTDWNDVLMTEAAHAS